MITLDVTAGFKGLLPAGASEFSACDNTVMFVFNVSLLGDPETGVMVIFVGEVDIL